MNREEMVARRDELKRIAQKRRGKPGFAANVEEIDGLIANLEAGIAAINGAANG
jgi:hypothetical protein